MSRYFYSRYDRGVLRGDETLAEVTTEGASEPLQRAMQIADTLRESGPSPDRSEQRAPCRLQSVCFVVGRHGSSGWASRSGSADPVVRA